MFPRVTTLAAILNSLQMEASATLAGFGPCAKLADGSGRLAVRAPKPLGNPGVAKLHATIRLSVPVRSSQHMNLVAHGLDAERLTAKLRRLFRYRL